MAVCRRIRLGGSVCTLSPTDGKDRVKGSSVRVTESGAISVPERARDQSRQAFSAFEMCSSTIAAFFTWQNDCDYRQYVLIKSLVFRQNRLLYREA